jgi:hypothetical protein
MSHTNHRRENPPQKRRRRNWGRQHKWSKNPETGQDEVKITYGRGRRDCLCHDTESRRAAEIRSGRKRKSNRTARRRLKENLAAGKNKSARRTWSWPGDLKKELREGSDRE